LLVADVGMKFLYDYFTTNIT